MSILPPAGCREEVCWRSRSWKRGGGGTEARSQKRVLSGSFTSREINRRKGAARGATRGPGAPLARPSPRSRQVAAWGPGGSHLVLLRDSGRFLHDDFLSDFSRIFGALLI